MSKNRTSAQVSVVDKGRGFTVRVKPSSKNKISSVEEMQAHLRVRWSASVTRDKKKALKTRGEKHRRRDY